MRKQTRQVKLDLETYNRLDELREKRESFSQAVERLIRVIDKVKDLAPLIYAEHIGSQRFPPGEGE